MDAVERADLHTLIGAYALDALEDDEREEFERHLADCEPCREEVVGFRRTAVRLAEAAAVVPPPRMHERVMQEIAATPQVRDTPGTPVRGAGRRMPPRSRLWLAAAAVLAVASVGLGGVAWNQYQAAQDARRTSQAITQILADRQAHAVTQRLPGGANATLVVAEDRAVLAGTALPALPDDRTYQLWIIRGKEITSAGLGPSGPGASASWSRLVPGVQPGDVVAVSVEPSGGSAQPTTTPIVTLKA
jgi:anti-sigma-K factor RskA